jgi:hypothetical protein
MTATITLNVEAVDYLIDLLDVDSGDNEPSEGVCDATWEILVLAKSLAERE